MRSLSGTWFPNAGVVQVRADNWPGRFGAGIGIRSSVSLPHPCSPPVWTALRAPWSLPMPRSCERRPAGSGPGGGAVGPGGGVRVLVVGAGPAGVATALLLARYGVEVDILCREHPRVSCPQMYSERELK